MPEKLVLGSGSPRRLELLSLLVDHDHIAVVRPTCDELSFADTTTSAAIDERLEANVRLKLNSVCNQTAAEQLTLCADTVVVVPDGEHYRVLGKPDGPDWQHRVSNWFTQFYFTSPHWVRTGFVLAQGDDLRFGIVETTVVFRQDSASLLPWYLKTGEPLGKAGGYGIQGAGSIFSEQVKGSLSNVIGLPLEAVLATLVDKQFPLAST